MAHESPIRNPFMLMLNPEIVLAAIENSERLGQLNRHLCRPLDRPTRGTAQLTDEASESDAVVDADEAVDRQ